MWQQLKNGMVRGLYRVLFRWLKVPFKSSTPYIVCYHGVSVRPDPAFNKRHVSVEQLSRDFAFYTRHFEVVPLHQMHKGPHTGKPRLALTFDDGYLNNFTNMLPLLRQYQIPATVFVIADALEQPDYITWYDLIDIVKSFQPKSIYFNSRVFVRKEGAYRFNTLLLEDYIKQMGPEREPALLALYEEHHAKIQAYKAHNADRWKLIDQNSLPLYLSNPYLYIGSHTCSHYNLEHLTSDLLHSELVGSKKSIEQVSKRKVTTLAFPDGSYNNTVKEASLAAGYTQLHAVHYRLDEDLKDPSIFKRYSYSNSTSHEVNMIKLLFTHKKVL